MSNNSNQSMSEGYARPNTSENTGGNNNENNNEAAQQSPTPFSGTLQVLPNPVTLNPFPPPLNCPVSSCSLVVAGRTPQRYLLRHLKYPGLYGRTGDERVAWLNIHKIEHARLIATRVKAAKLEEQKASRAAALRLRARQMGITDTELIADKLKIWEGMWDDNEKGDSIGHDAWVLLDVITNL